MPDEDLNTSGDEQYADADPNDEESLKAQWGDARDPEGDGDDVTETDPVVDEDYEEDDE